MVPLSLMRWRKRANVIKSSRLKRVIIDALKVIDKPIY
ncbi:unnamed protein product [Mycetohabitans rhizoxinica HKI 454]|uniref:Uncharacterized protein n=1 Tax=Mycetohabitans rhizoxinica (strain DSM 19002 / CIP 109453 / HKI 454) TaxID=882378 RepID=E5ASY8_MYCRK|nr:unnamed protein product [Mycetohabitans rhizoxinica HKI 454]